ncbi:GCG_CRPN prefix-to-repeats domain-containing protein [Bradyrhizobium sp. LHD-71]|uniref:GCG_CRPN prefix-to-repeats domain-containing protein n=1 Tax=Bradyrhizobium sp. LHD-71 TaxID=3072141 RepID=UPI0035BE538A
MRIGLFLAATIGLGVTLIPVDSQALPIFPTNQAQQADQFIQVRQGCGVGWHRGPYGGCRRNTAAYGPRGANACWFVRTPGGPRKVCR